MLLTHVIDRFRVDLNKHSTFQGFKWCCFEGSSCFLGLFSSWLALYADRFFSTRWQHGHQQLQAHILLALILADRDVSFLRVPLLGLNVTAPTWVMSLGRWKVLVMCVLPAPQRGERAESAVPKPPGLSVWAKKVPPQRNISISPEKRQWWLGCPNNRLPLPSAKMLPPVYAHA